jgi:VWFA-related protein
MGVLTRLMVVALLVTGQQPPAQQQPAQPQPAQQQPPTFRTSAEVVRVDVTVLGRNGRPVTNLTQDDFVVFEDGVPQRIQAFQFIAFNGEHGPDEDLELTIRPRDSSRNAELARDDVRMFLVFWDEYHILPNYQEQFLKGELLAFLKTMLNPTDLVAIMDPWTPMSDLWFSRDRYKLATQVSALRGRQGILIPRNGAEENHFSMNNRVPFVREQVSLTALKSAMSYMGTLREGRKTILYVSQEFGLGRDTHRWAGEVTQVANAENVSVYSINPQGLQVSGSNFRAGLLASIAHGTGGESFVSNSPAVAFGRAVSQSSAAYLLGYSPSPLHQDGSYHKIDVKVKGSGLQVRARDGYLAPDATQKEAARAATKEAELPTPIESAFEELTRLGRPQDEGDRGDVKTIVVPEDPSPELALIPPDVWLIRRPADLKAVKESSPPAPETAREFTRMDRLMLKIVLQGERSANATLSAGLIGRRGKRLTDLPFARGEGVWWLDLPLQSIARGDYLIELTATAGDLKTTAYVPVRVKER